MDVLKHLTDEHREVEQIIAQLKPTDPGAERDRLLDELVSSLGVHMAVEEQFLYPIVRTTIGEDDAEEAENEHQLIRDSLASLRELADEGGFGAALDMLEGGISHHVKEEEEDLFPELREVAGAEIEAMDPEALEAAADKTRAQLYEEAKAAEVAGRSTMSRAELAEAVAKPK